MYFIPRERSDRGTCFAGIEPPLSRSLAALGMKYRCSAGVRLLPARPPAPLSPYRHFTPTPNCSREKLAPVTMVFPLVRLPLVETTRLANGVTHSRGLAPIS